MIPINWMVIMYAVNQVVEIWIQLRPYIKDSQQNKIAAWYLRLSVR